MKTKKKHRVVLSLASSISLIIAFFFLVSSCDNKDYSKESPFSNSVYIDAAKVKDIANFTFNNIQQTGEQQISAVLAYPAEQDIEVSFQVDPSLISHYNARLGNNYAMLDAKYYKFSTQNVVIPKGDINSETVTIEFFDLTDLDIDTSFLLPVTIEQASGDMGILNGSKTICYIVRRSSAITTAVSLANNYFVVPGFEADSPTAYVVNGLNQLTFEAIVRVNKFDPLTEISTIMGIEQYCLFRFGDSGFPRQQLQFAANEIKFPNADESKLLQPGEWYHVAVTYDTGSKTAVMYVDGKEQSRIDDYGNGEPINLGKQKKGYFMFKIGHSYGEPDDMSRQLNGEICEVRIWNVIRSQEEIYNNMYDVVPQTTGLTAYWKFNEGKGNNIVKDFTGNGNDAVAYTDAVWPNGIEVPQKNKD
ncbi:DUF1735 and LamG domain-containing protein [Bacteroides cellulosilyticus]|uniref:DUF1735 and LamG domain-containing protein n=1 Tax=Bacteroides cellulosilyticus TaxID=246787 RepID=UPI003561AE43